MAEVVLNRLGKGRFRAYSAGIAPRGEVHPIAVKALEAMGDDLTGLRSKSWEEFTGPDAPKMDFIITLCDASAGESCPTLPGEPLTAHWDFPDPAAFEGTDEQKLKAFEHVEALIAGRIRLMLELSPEKLDHLAIHRLT